MNSPLLITSLQAINDPQHLAGIAPGARRVHHSQTDLLGGVDYEDGADGEGDSLFADIGHVLGVKHVVEEGNFALGVRDDGKLQGSFGDVVNVLDPGVVGGEVVGGLGGRVSDRTLFLKDAEAGGFVLTSPIILTPRFSNSSLIFAKAPSSVVQTGVKSAGWEKRMPQLSPSQEWKSMSP